MIWRKLGTGERISLIEYLHTWLKENKEHKLYIGCDSQNIGDRTKFAVAIVLHHPRKGGHVIYSTLSLPKMGSKNSSYERLWKEVEISVETAQELMNNGIQKPDYIDIDLNSDPRYRSNDLLRAAVGLVESLGIEARYKTLSNWSIAIADNLCK
jgi:predicted RNase H-related nuclease YkuK (DUF458 family)